MEIQKAKKEDIPVCISIAVEAFNFSRDFMNNEIVGYGYFQYREWNNTTYLESLAVKKDIRNKGIGTRLLQEIIKQSKKFGARRIFVDMDINNEKVIDFYMKNDFVKAGTIKDFSEEGKTALILSKNL